MNPARSRTRRRTVNLLAGAILVGFPLTALWLAPSAQADGSPGANLAGINAAATATGLLFSPLTPGLVGAGNVTKGNLIETAIPYATSSTSTGPVNSGVASPAYPGDTAAQLGTVFNTFAPLPAPVQNALNDPVLARSDYPPQVSVGSNASYAPPTGSAAGALTASSSSTPSGTTSNAALNQTSLPSGLIDISSTTTKTVTNLQASSVEATAHTDVGRISLLGGAVVIAGLTSDASATSDGTNGQQNSDLHIGQVKVAGQPAYIGPDGIHLAGSGQGGILVPTLNEVLTALAQAGISVHTIEATTETDGSSAAVTSGALQVSFLDQHIPNPSGVLPLNTIGFDLDIGISSALADATALPPFDSSSGSIGSSGDTGSSNLGATLAGGAGVSGLGTASPAGPELGGTGSALAVPGSPTLGTPTVIKSRPSSSAPAALATPQPAALLGAPVKVAWVVIAVLLSIVAAGPLLGYANWQLLRGRRT